MEIIINLDELKIASKEIQNEVEALQGLTSSIEKAIRPLFLMKSARLETYLEIYNKITVISVRTIFRLARCEASNPILLQVVNLIIWIGIHFSLNNSKNLPRMPAQNSEWLTSSEQKLAGRFIVYASVR